MGLITGSLRPNDQKQDVDNTVPKNIRVYELARELGMENKEVLDLCEILGIGVKSHSSGIVEAQGDRVRRRAAKDGLIREVVPEPEPEPVPEPVPEPEPE
ncbi:MAG: translation initiation factor IF-2 N-terminal domain-containing protein, partial [Actinomycetota bacterium]|nr:translation initiation factor IF-2 N-terminal domain-containing protein [Actinomycetota bacterium]